METLIQLYYIYIYIYVHIYIYPPTTLRHAVCTVIYNIACSFFMLTFCGYLYIFIRTSSYKQKHNITQQYSDPLWGVYSKPGREFKHVLEPKKMETLWGGPLGENQKTKTKKPNPLEILQSPWLCFFFLSFLSFLFWGGLSIYIYIHTTHGWFEMPISFFWEWQAVGARCFISFDHHTQKREGGVVSAFFSFLTFQTLLLL